MRTWITLLLVVSLLAGNLLAVGHVHAATDAATGVELQVDADTDSPDPGHATHGHCDVCGHTSGQPGAVVNGQPIDADPRSMRSLAPSVAFTERPVPVPLQPPRSLLRR